MQWDQPVSFGGRNAIVLLYLGALIRSTDVCHCRSITNGADDLRRAVSTMDATAVESSTLELDAIQSLHRYHWAASLDNALLPTTTLWVWYGLITAQKLTPAAMVDCRSSRNTSDYIPPDEVDIDTMLVG